MNAIPGTDRLECEGVSVTRDTFAALQDGRIVQSVPKADIQRITLHRGFLAKHPVTQCVLSLVLIGLGLLPIASVIHWFRFGGVLWDIELLMFLLLLLGTWLGYESLQRGYYLSIERRGDEVKIAFSKRAELETIRAFLSAARDSWDYPVQGDV